MTSAIALPTSRPAPEPDIYVLPARLTRGKATRGPRFSEDVWDLKEFLPRARRAGSRIDFRAFEAGEQRQTAKEYIYSRLRRASGRYYRPMKPTSVNVEVYRLTKLFRDLRVVGISNLADVELTNLDALLALWKQSGLHNTVAMVNTLKHVSAHGPFLSHDRLSLVPWPHRSAQQVAGWKQTNRENTTPRIPEEVMRPFLAAALFYVQIASGDLLAAQRELTRLKSELPTGRTRPGSVRQRLDAFIAGRRAEGRGLPSLPLQLFHNAPGAEIRDGVVQAPNLKMIQLLISSHGLHHYRQRIVAAGNELGWEVGGIPVTMSPWPATGKPWHPGLSRHTVFTEINHLRIACWVVIAYLSGMRDDETGRSCI